MQIRSRLALISVLSLSCATAAYAQPPRDMHDLRDVHDTIQQAIQAMQRARAANNYDMEGHGEKAQTLLEQADREVGAAIEAASHHPPHH